MATELYIVTGTSRGLGAALAEQLLAAGHVVVGLARGRNPRLDALAAAGIEQWSVDLAAAQPAAERLERWLAARAPGEFDRATLINNAAALTRSAPLADIDPADLTRALRVGLEAPLLLAGAFLRATRGWRAERRVLNVSSGLGRRGMAAQVAYCAVKAGLDNASRALALEGAARVVALAPGVIDTDMQAQLRGADPGAFPEQPHFAQLHAQARLTPAAHAARQVLAFLARADFGAQPVADVRDA